MKAIGNIFLAWRMGKGSRRILVGLIKNNSTGGSRFAYIHDGVAEANQFGFSSYDGFSDLDKEYNENIIDIFGQRIMRSERNDIDDFYAFWKINKEYKENNYYMLAYTQGLLPTDNFEFLADFNPVKGLSFVSEISGLSRNLLPIDALQSGDALRYEKEPSNSFDRYAIKLYKGNLFLGYIKLVHNRVFSKTKKEVLVKVHSIEKSSNIERVFLHISIL